MEHEPLASPCGLFSLLDAALGRVRDFYLKNEPAPAQRPVGPQPSSLSRQVE
jgi:hypothetical protein